MTDIIELGLLQKWPNELTECQVIKEHLITIENNMFNEIYEVEDNNGIPDYQKNIIVNELNKRKKVINHYLKIEIDRCLEIKKKYGII